MGVRTGLDESLAFTALLELDPEGFGKLGMADAAKMRQELQDAYYASDSTNLFSYARVWLAGRQEASAAPEDALDRDPAIGPVRDLERGSVPPMVTGRTVGDAHHPRPERDGQVKMAGTGGLAPATGPEPLTEEQLSAAAQREARIITLGGRTGRLTGYKTREGDPYVSFDSGQEYAIPPHRIAGVVSTAEEDAAFVNQREAERYGGNQEQAQRQG